MILRFFLYATMMTLLSCAAFERRVSFDEMPEQPEVVIDKDSIVVKTKNSVMNTAYSISRIEMRFNDTAYILKGYQRVGAPYRERFVFSRAEAEEVREDSLEIPWYWEDHNGELSEVRAVLIE